MNSVFWLLVGLNVTVLVIALASSFRPATWAVGDGRLGLSLLVLTPIVASCLLISLSMANPSLPWQWIAIAGMAAPSFILAGTRVRERFPTPRAGHPGSAHFRTRKLQRLASAVCQLDVQAVRHLGPDTDVNTVGRSGATLLCLAIGEIAAAGHRPEVAARGLMTVKALLAFGADPSAGLEAAIELRDPSILRELVTSGGNPNLVLENGQALVFKSLGTMPLESLRILQIHGLNLNACIFGEPLVVVVARLRRWDLLAFLAQQGADVERIGRDGRRAVDEVNAQMTREFKATRTVSSALLEVAALLHMKSATGSAR